MTLDEYLRSPGAKSIATLRVEVGAKSDIQIRQWRHGYANRRPSMANAVSLEYATAGKVPVEVWGFDVAWRRIKDRHWPWNGGRPLVDHTAEMV